ncbi:MAG TPA: hypothetical protein VKB45_11095 [Gemmatimonadales bacterium]|nr:hypothetical protein [Gemmatimonadales bacterium]
MRQSLVALLMVVAAGCRSDVLTRGLDAPSPDGRPAVGVGLEASSLDAQVGERILVVVRLAQSSSLDRVAGVQGAIRFDPTRLQFVGQTPAPPTLVMVSDARAAQGLLRVLSVNARGLPERMALVAFQVMAPDYLRGLRFEGSQAVTQRLQSAALSISPEIRRVSDTIPLPSADAARRLGVAEWDALLAPGLGHAALTPGQIVPGLRYGDVTLDGAINVRDVVMNANVAVGMADLLVNPSVDVVIAGNVAPFNLPGLGEVGDASPPGRNADGTFTIDVLDVVAISNEAVGVNQPVVGEAIPGRVALPTARAVVADTVHADRTFFRDTVYELHGTVIVPGSVTLTIEAGTQVEGDVATRGALAVQRGGRLHAVGTRLQPVVFTCTAAAKSPGCWGGIILNGASLLNNGSGTTGIDIGCPEKVAPGNAGTYGGCRVQDSSGTLRYVRIEYGGMMPPGGSATAGLLLLGVGTGTVIDSIQVHGSGGDGVFLSGGTADLRNVFITGSTAAGLRWDDGWVGRVQFLAVLQSGGPALSGSNSLPDSNAGPRSHPRIFNATIAGTAQGGGGGILLEHGTALTLGDAIVQQSGVGLDVNGDASCAQAAALTIDISSSIFFGGTPDFSTDVDCLDEAAYATDPARGNALSDPLLIAPLNTLTPDLRPRAGSPASLGGASAPPDGFFMTGVPYIGAVEPANGAGSNIPWYAGWTRGWLGSP